MDALLLTYDRQLGLAELVHKGYRAQWPSHPFRFRIPVTGAGGGAALAYLAEQPDCELVRCPADIKASMAALLEGTGDASWVFWCIDDRYPTWVDPARLAAVCADLPSVDEDVDEVKLLRWKEPVTSRRAVVGGVPFVHQAGRSQPRGFWHHHFVRARLLKRIFLRRSLPEEAPIGDVLPLEEKGSRRRLPKTIERDLFPGRALVPDVPIASLGEPLRRGALTRNGLADLQASGCEVPPYAVADVEVVYSWTPP